MMAVCRYRGGSQHFTFPFTRRISLLHLRSAVLCGSLSYSRVTAGAFRTAPSWQDGDGASSPLRAESKSTRANFVPALQSQASSSICSSILWFASPPLPDPPKTNKNLHKQKNGEQMNFIRRNSQYCSVVVVAKASQ